MKIKINLSLKLCLLEKGIIDQALDKSEYFVQLLNDAENKNNNFIILNEKNKNSIKNTLKYLWKNSNIILKRTVSEINEDIGKRTVLINNLNLKNK